MTLERRFVKYFANDSPSNFWMNVNFFTRKLEGEGFYTPKGDIYISSLNKPKDYEGKRIVLLSDSEPKHIGDILEEMDIVRFKKND